MLRAASCPCWRRSSRYVETSIPAALPLELPPAARPRSRGRGSLRWGRGGVTLILLLATLFSALSMGCVKVYQPVSGLNRPVVIDTQVANFQDVRLAIYCPPGDLVNAEEARALCRKVGLLFENQGAQVTTFSSDRRHGDDSLGNGLEDEEAEQVSEPAPIDLAIELRGRQVHQAVNELSWVLFIGTFTLVPGVSEFTFAQDVVIRDASGFLLVSDSLQGRVVRYSGAGMWITNKILRLGLRDKEDRRIGDKPHGELSEDFYGQLSQLLFNAKMQWQVLQEAAPAGSAD